MRERTRWVLMALAGATALLAGATLIALRAGRPLFYSDGEQTHFGAGVELREAPMLLWGRPEPEAELVGPVRGRVATLPDGSVVYGRAQGEGRTELVHAPRAGAEPVPIVALSSAGHDLAPTLAHDGQTVFFASDRAHANGGGYDLWQARYDGRGFYPPNPLAGEVATAGDEVDPVLDPRTGELVFARRAVGEAWFRLWTVPLDASRAPELLLPEASSGTMASAREPAFAADGSMLWFVRRAGDGPIELTQTYRHVGRFVTPTVVAALRQPLGLRAPEVLDEGRSLRLLDAERGLLYRARAREVHPWWEGQRALEQTLWVLLVVALLVLALLILGRRWRALDVVTWCLIASVLLHVAILLWLRGVEIVRRYQTPGPHPGQMEVTLVAAGSLASASDVALGSLASEVAFASQADAMQVAGPESTLVEPERSLPRAISAERAMDAASAPTAALAMEVPTDVHDTPETMAARAERAVAGALTPTAVAIEARAPGVEVARAVASATERVVVEVPGAAGGALVQAPVTEAPAGERDEHAPVASAPLTRAAARASAAPADAPGEVPQRAALAHGAAPIGAVQVDVAPRLPSVEVARAAAPPGGAVEAARAPVSEMFLAQVDAAPAGVPAFAAPRARPPRPDALALADAPASPARRSGGPDPGMTAALAASAPRLAVLDAPPLAPQTDGVLEVSAAPTPAGGADRAPEQPTARLAPTPPRRGVARERREDVRARSSPVRAPMLADAPSPATTSSQATAASPEQPLRNGPVGDLSQSMTNVSAPPRSVPDATRELGSLPIPTSALGVVGAAPAALGRAASAPPTARTFAPRRPLVADGVATPTPAGQPKRASPPAPLAALGSVPLVAASAVPRPARRGETIRPTHELTQGIELPPSALPVPPTDWQAVAGVAARDIPEFYRNRFGPQKAAALEMFGGSPETEGAVRRGLEYLARIQQRDGGWGRRRRDHDKYGEVHVGKSALCLLAFLGAGHTPGSATEYAAKVEAAVTWLLAEQDHDTGHFGETSSYSHGITTYALAECYAMTKDARLREPLERAVAWIVKNQNRTRDRRSFGGWPYFSASLRPEDRFARTSVTAWMVMALKSARMSGLAVADGVFEDATTFLWGMFESEHDSFLYNKEPSRLASAWRSLPGSTPAAVFCLLLTGADRDDPRLRAALAWTLERAPGPYRRYRDDDFVLRGAGNVYFWYYGSLACFLAGGEVWPAWNSALKDSLLAGQDVDGSFPIIDVYAEYAGDTDRDRAYTTAMCVLSLEAYYRYLTPMVRPR